MKNKNLKSKWIICAAIIFIVTCILLGKYGYRKIASPYINNYKFKQSFAEATKIPDRHWDDKYKDEKPKEHYKVVYVVNNGGEYSYGKYFKYAAERIGWEVKLYRDSIDASILDFDPDFILFSRQVNADLDMEIIAHRSKKYLVLFSSMITFKGYSDYIISSSPPFFPLGGFGHLLSLSHGVITSGRDLDMYREMFDSQQKIFNGMRMLSTVPRTNNITVEPKKLMWIGTGWDASRNSVNFKKFIALLSQTTQMKAYGIYNNLTFLAPGTYDGYIAPGMDNIAAIQKNGIYLLTNSDWHFKGGEPGMRIFEAIAAGAVVISDMHPFAIENFGDNFLYFDQTADADTMYKQVKAHYDWIKANPEKAKAMASRAHKIFLEKFTLEQDLKRIAKMHEHVTNQEKRMNLSYPLAYKELGVTK